MDAALVKCLSDLEDDLQLFATLQNLQQLPIVLPSSLLDLMDPDAEIDVDPDPDDASSSNPVTLMSKLIFELPKRTIAADDIHCLHALAEACAKKAAELHDWASAQFVYDRDATERDEAATQEQVDRILKYKDDVQQALVKINETIESICKICQIDLKEAAADHDGQMQRPRPDPLNTSFSRNSLGSKIELEATPRSRLSTVPEYSRSALPQPLPNGPVRIIRDGTAERAPSSGQFRFWMLVLAITLAAILLGAFVVPLILAAALPATSGFFLLPLFQQALYPALGMGLLGFVASWLIAKPKPVTQTPSVPAASSHDGSISEADSDSYSYVSGEARSDWGSEASEVVLGKAQDKKMRLTGQGSGVPGAVRAVMFHFPSVRQNIGDVSNPTVHQTLPAPPAKQSV